jgi:hypothetical protein
LANVVGFIGFFALCMWLLSDVQVPDWAPIAGGVLAAVSLVIFIKGLVDRRHRGREGMGNG